jgi:hypothetical protein
MSKQDEPVKDKFGASGGYPNFNARERIYLSEEEAKRILRTSKSSDATLHFVVFVSITTFVLVLGWISTKFL